MLLQLHMEGGDVTHASPRQAQWDQVYSPIPAISARTAWAFPHLNSKLALADTWQTQWHEERKEVEPAARPIRIETRVEDRGAQSQAFFGSV